MAPAAPSEALRQSQPVKDDPRPNSNVPVPMLRSPVVHARQLTLPENSLAEAIKKKEAATRVPQGSSQTYRAAGSEDMESRSIEGSAEVARAAFGQELNVVTGQVQAVSLGGSCGPKISLRRLGLGEATMPFDWMRTRATGLIHWLRHGFDDFMAVQQKMEVSVQGTSMTVFRSPTHSFWHDDIEDDTSREKLQRRIERFLDLASAEGETASRPLLFVRGVAGAIELEQTEDLFLALCERFEVNGRKVWLLLILEDQPILGPVMHSKHAELILWVQPRYEGQVSTNVRVPSPYEDAIAFTVRRILGERGGLFPGEESEAWPMVDKASDILTQGSTFWKAGCRGTEVGLWVGNVLLKSASHEVLMSAFQGLDKLEGESPQVPPPCVVAAAPVSGTVRYTIGNTTLDTRSLEAAPVVMAY